MGAVTPEKIEEALTHARRTGSRLGEALIDLQMCTEEQIARALCRQNTLPFVDLAKSRIPEAVIDLVDSNVVEEYDMVPVKKQGRQIVCAIADPAQVYQADGLQFVLNAEVKFALTTPTGLKRAPPTSTSSRWPTGCASGTASTGSASSRSRCRRTSRARS
jgi:type IV pilus assembly protein PilB